MRCAATSTGCFVRSWPTAPMKRSTRGTFRSASIRTLVRGSRMVDPGADTFGVAFASEVHQSMGWRGSRALRLRGDSFELAWRRNIMARDTVRVDVANRLAHLAVRRGPVLRFHDAQVASVARCLLPDPPFRRGRGASGRRTTGLFCGGPHPSRRQRRRKRPPRRRTRHVRAARHRSGFRFRDVLCREVVPPHIVLRCSELVADVRGGAWPRPS